MQDDHGPHLRVEPEEAAFELVTSDDRRHGVIDRRGMDGGQFDVDAMASDPARFIDAGADQEPVQPGVEAIEIAERGQITPGPDERVLHRVLGLVRIPEDEPSGAIEAGEFAAAASSAKAS